jgi:hypothetical protein
MEARMSGGLAVWHCQNAIGGHRAKTTNYPKNETTNLTTAPGIPLKSFI